MALPQRHGTRPDTFRELHNQFIPFGRSVPMPGVRFVGTQIRVGGFQDQKGIRANLHRCTKRENLRVLVEEVVRFT